MAPEVRCRGTNQDGSSCAAPAQLVDPSTGYCRGHDPALRDELREQGKKGGERMAARFRQKALRDDELPELTPETAEEWCAIIGRASVTGRISASQAQSALRAVSELLRANEATSVRERLEKLREAVDEMKGRKLERVK